MAGLRSPSRSSSQRFLLQEDFLSEDISLTRPSPTAKLQHRLSLYVQMKFNYQRLDPTLLRNCLQPAPFLTNLSQDFPSLLAVTLRI